MRYRFAIRNVRDQDAHDTLERYKLASLGGVVKRGVWVDRSRTLTGEETEGPPYPDSWVEIEMTFDQVRELIGRQNEPGDHYRRFPRGLILNREQPNEHILRAREGYWTRLREWRGDERAEYTLTFYDDYME